MSRRAIEIGAVAALVALAGWSLAARDTALLWEGTARQAARPTSTRIEGGGPLLAAGEAEAAARLAGLIADRGSAAGIRLSVKPLADAVPLGFASVDLDARGSEQALRGFASAIEQDRPLVRLVRWSIRPSAEGLLRLEARAVAPVQVTR